MPTIVETLLDCLEEHKAEQITCLDVSSATPMTDHMIVCTASSVRHAQALMHHCSRVIKTNHTEAPAVKIEGESNDDWVLLDFGMVIVHLMTQERRDFYQIEKLWQALIETGARGSRPSRESE